VNVDESDKRASLLHRGKKFYNRGPDAFENRVMITLEIKTYRFSSVGICGAESFNFNTVSEVKNVKIWF
jgi:hypothetical protein